MALLALMASMAETVEQAFARHEPFGTDPACWPAGVHLTRMLKHSVERIDAGGAPGSFEHLFFFQGGTTVGPCTEEEHPPTAGVPRKLGLL